MRNQKRIFKCFVFLVLVVMTVIAVDWKVSQKELDYDEETDYDLNQDYDDGRGSYDGHNHTDDSCHYYYDTHLYDHSDSSTQGSSSQGADIEDPYDNGYDDIYFEGEYDEDRYDSDPDYAEGVDDAMLDEEEDDW